MLLFVISNAAIFSQQYSYKTVTVGEDTFLPYLKGKIVNRINKNDVLSQRIFIILQSQPSVNSPQGYEVEVYSDGTNRMLELSFMPYLLDEGETARKPGSVLSIYINEIAPIFGQPLQSGIGDIYTAPTITGHFMGCPIYKQDGHEATVIYKGNEPLFLPVSQEEYLNALIQQEEQKYKKNGNSISIDENLKEIEKTYQELLKTDRITAEEFKEEMENYRKDLPRDNTAEDLATFYKKELARLSTSQRKQQAYYAIYAMEKYGNFSGLVPESDTENVLPLVKPNYKSISKNTNSNICLMVVKWKLCNKEYRNSPRDYQPQNKSGYALTDDKISELYHNQTVWECIVELVK